MVKGINITGYAYNLISKSNTDKSSGSFESIMTQKTKTSSESKTDNSQKTTDSRKTDKTDRTDRTDRTDNKQTDNTDTQNNTEQKQETKSKNTDEKKSDTQKVDEKQSEKAEGKEEKDVIEEIAEITGSDAQTVMSVLQSLNMNVADLADNNNLVAFMQKLMNVDSAVDLISIDNITDIMAEVQQTAQDFAEFSEVMGESISESDFMEENIMSHNERTSESKRETIKQTPEDTVSENQTEKPLENKIEIVDMNDFKGGGFFENNSETPQENEFKMPENFSVQTMSGNINKALNNTAVKTEAVRNVNTADVVNQIIEKIKVSSNAEITEMNIKLKPEELGELSLRIISDNGVITAQFTAESQRVKEIIEASFDLLKDALAQSGVEVSQLEVNVGNDSQNGSGFDAYDDFTQRSFYPEKDEPISASAITESEVLQSNVSYMA